MKRFAKIEGDLTGFDTLPVLKQVICHGGAQQGLSVDQIRDRIKLLDALEADGPTVDLTEDQHEVLCGLLRSHPWAVANRELLAVIDGVIEAETVKGH